MQRRTSIISTIILCTLLMSCGSSARVTGPTESPPEQLYVDTLPEIDPKDYLSFFDYDQAAPLDIQETKNWREENSIWVEFSYTSPKGGRVPATLVLPEGTGPFAGALLQHGMPSNRQSMYGMAEIYAKYGLAVLLIDAPFNRPENSERIWPRGVPLTFKEQDREDHIQLILDLRRAVDLLENRPEIDPDRLAYIGISFGGMVGGLLAGVEHRLKAYVLVVGDGGLVTHLTGRDDEDNFFGSPFYMLTDDRKERWLDAMWPLESIHYIGLASPASLLFQNGVNDNAVPFFDAYRYQDAGSEPKEIQWYDAPHFLPRESMVDQVHWLHQQVGAGTVFFAPRFDAGARLPDLAISTWLLLTIIAFVYSLWELAWRKPAPWAIRLPWWLAILLIGPLGLLVYFLTPKLQAETSQATASKGIWRPAFGLTMWSVAANFIGIILSSLIIIAANSIPPLAQLALLYVCARLSAFFSFWLLRRLSNREGVRIPALGRPYFAQLVTTSSVLAGAILISVVLGKIWFPFGPTPSPLYWSIYIWGAIASVIVSLPFHAWLVYEGILVWDKPAPVGPPTRAVIAGPKRLSWYKALGALILSYGSLFFLTTSSIIVSQGVTLKDVLGVFLSI